MAADSQDRNKEPKDRAAEPLFPLGFLTLCPHAPASGSFGAPALQLLVHPASHPGPRGDGTTVCKTPVQANPELCTDLVRDLHRRTGRSYVGGLLYTDASTETYSRRQTTGAFLPGTVFHVKPLKRPLRRGILVVHVAASAGWLGLTLGLLALALTAFTTGSQPVIEASYRSMKVFTDWLVLPVAFLTLLSGLILSLGTKWGLARHWWVFIKFWLTLATTTASVLALRPGVNETAERVASGVVVADPRDLVMGPAVSLAAYLFMTVISVLKPWGTIRRGRRPRASVTSPKAVDERSVRQTA